MAITVPKLSAYIGKGLNVIITGYAGTGKTQMLLQACEKLNLRVKYYSASTLDPFADLVGIPVPDTKNKTMDFYRPRDVDQAQVIFFDELNRADEKTLNAIFEIIQFGTINGEELPHLICVVAAINPVEDGYNTDELDIALLDRFDVYLESDVVADPVYFKKKFGTEFAKVGIDLFRDYQLSYINSQRSNQNTLGYFSPRRLEKLMEIFTMFPVAATFADVLPSDVIVSAASWSQKFNIALGNATDPNAPRRTTRTTAQISGGNPITDRLVERQLSMAAGETRRKANATSFKKAYNYAKENNPAIADNLLTNLSIALSMGVGAGTLKDTWLEPLKDFNDRHIATIQSKAIGAKKSEMRDLFLEIKNGII